MSHKKPTIKNLADLFTGFFKIGAFTIGGGYAMLPFIEKEVVEQQKLIDEKEVIDIFAVSQSLPGVISINACMFIGYKSYGILGAIVGTLGVVLPSFVTILAIFYLLLNIQDNVYLSRAFTGIRAGVAALVLVTCISYYRRNVKDRMGILLTVAGFSMIALLSLSAVYAIIFGGVVGLLYYYPKNKKKALSNGDRADNGSNE